MMSHFSECWRWQPSEMMELEVDEFADFYDDLTEIKAAQERAVRAAMQR